MSDVVNFQESLIHPSKQPLHHYLKRHHDDTATATATAAGAGAGAGEGKNKAKREKEKLTASSTSEREAEAVLSPHMLAILREEGDSSLSGDSTPLDSGRDGMGANHTYSGGYNNNTSSRCNPSILSSSTSLALHEERRKMASTLQEQTKQSARVAAGVLTRYQEQRVRYTPLPFPSLVLAWLLPLWRTVILTALYPPPPNL